MKIKAMIVILYKLGVLNKSQYKLAQKMLGNLMNVTIKEYWEDIEEDVEKAKTEYVFDPKEENPKMKWEKFKEWFV